MLQPQTNSVFLAAFLSWSTQFVVLTLHLHGAQTPPGKGRRGSNLKKGEQGDRRVEEVQDNYRGEKNKTSGCAHITGQPLIVLHQLLIFLVDSQHFADPVGRRLRLDDEDEGRNSVRPRAQSKLDGVTVDGYLVWALKIWSDAVYI